MMQQPTALGGGFPGEIFGRKFRPSSLYAQPQERSSSGVDLLDAKAREVFSPSHWEQPEPPVSFDLPDDLNSRQLITAKGNRRGELGENSKHVIGHYGVKRFDEFKTYHAGWDSGRGNPLSTRSVSVLNSFLNRFLGRTPPEPSLFLTRQGNLQLGWEDSTGTAIELEFFPDRIEFFIEALNEEGSVGLESQSPLVAKIKSIL